MEESAFPNFDLLDSEMNDDSSYQLSLPSQPPDIRNWLSSYESQQSVDSIKDAYFPHITELNDSETQDPFEDSRKRKLQEPCLSPEKKIQPDLSKDTFARDDSLNPTMEEIFRKKCTGTDGVVVKKKQILRKILGEEFLTSCQKIVISQSLSPDKKIIPGRDNHDKSKSNELDAKTGQDELEKKCQELSSINSEQKKDNQIHHTSEKLFETSETGFISLKRPKLHGDIENETKNRVNCGNKGQDRVGCRRSLEDKTNIPDKDREGDFRGTLVNETEFFVDAVPGLSSGKWQCPRKRKPYVGPPMKQLQLEQWIRRVS